MILLRSLTFISQNLIFILIGLIGIGFLIGFHELGHFLFCKLFNIRTPSFSIGFGPRIFTKKIGQTEFALSAIPLGGYVEIAGSSEMGQGEQKDAHATDKNSFAVKPYYQKLLVMFGGILFNLIFAYFALILLFMIGMPKPVPIIRSIQADSGAAQYFKPGDKIIAIDNQPVEESLEKFNKLITPFADKEVSIIVNRDGQETTLLVPVGGTPNPQGQRTGTIKGLQFKMIKTEGNSFGQAITKGITTTNKFIINTVQGFKDMLVKRDVSNVQGPLSIITIIMDGISQSFAVFLLLLAVISINLAILNLIPLPILDGGQILYYTIEAIIGRPIPMRVREYIHIACWLLLVGLIVYLTAFEFYKMIKPLLAKFF